MSNLSIRSKQNPLALFLLALALMSVGFVWAYRDTAQSEQGNGGFEEWSGEFGSLDFSTLKLNRDIQSGPIKLSYSTNPGQKLLFHARQLSAHDGSALKGAQAMRTTIQIPFEQRLESRHADGQSHDEVSHELALVREFHSVSIDVVEEGDSVGQDITDQLGNVLSGMVQKGRMTNHGIASELHWSRDTNPQVHKTLNLVEDVFSLLMPRFHADSINIGETWLYEVPMLTLDAQAGVSLKGSLVIHNRLEGIREQDGDRFAYISQSIEADVEASLYEGSDNELAVTIQGGGRGKVVFAVDRGELIATQMTLEGVRKAVHTTDNHGEFHSHAVIDLQITTR